jgi:hypothetical protein
LEIYEIADKKFAYNENLLFIQFLFSNNKSEGFPFSTTTTTSTITTTAITTTTNVRNQFKLGHL